jgi:hypothetical protein
MLSVLFLFHENTMLDESHWRCGSPTRTTKLEKNSHFEVDLSAEPGNLNGKTLTKTFKIFRSGTPEEWMLWLQDFCETCTGMSIVTGANHNRM